MAGMLGAPIGAALPMMNMPPGQQQQPQMIQDPRTGQIVRHNLLLTDLMY